MNSAPLALRRSELRSDDDSALRNNDLLLDESLWRSHSRPADAGSSERVF